MMRESYTEIDLLRLIKAIWHRIWIVILACVLCAAGAYSYARFAIAPVYQAYVLMYVNNSSFSMGSTTFSFNASELAAAQGLVDTYAIILKTHTTLNEVIREGNLNMSYEQLNGMVRAASENGTEVFRVTVTSRDPYQAAEIANLIARLLPAKLSNIVEGSSVRTVDQAYVNTRPVSPNISRYTMTGLLLGAAISCALIVLAELMDNQIHDDEILASISNIPVLASVPNLFKSKSEGYSHYYYNYYYHRHGAADQGGG